MIPVSSNPFTKWAYFDSSVLVKNYVEESGSARARRLIRKYRFLSSILAPLELIAALSRRRASGDLDEEAFSSRVLLIGRNRAYWKLLQISQQVTNRAEKIVQESAVRTLDAIHLASAMEFQTAIGKEVPFVTADGRQRDTAERYALNIVWIE